MRVNLAVSGRFHYHNVAPYLYKRGVLNCFYYAHRISTDGKSLGIPAERLVNVWIKEYLLQGHSRLSWLPGLDVMGPAYRQIWESVSLANWMAGDLLHIMLHGGGVNMISRAHSDGAVVIGEPVNAHPNFQNEVLNFEYERLKIRKRLKLSIAQNRMINEFGICDRLLVASQFVKRTFVEEGSDETKIDVLPFGVNLSRFSIKSDADRYRKKFRVICVAAISIRKGQVDLLEAWKHLALPDSELILIGSLDPEMRGMLKSYSGIFTHIPFVANQELGQYFNESSVFVLPTLEDGSSLVCGEAMASGLPVITTVNNGAAELVDDGVNGYVVPIRSPHVIAEKLSLLHRDREKAATMGKIGAEKMQLLSGWDGYGGKLVEIYLNALA